MSATDDSPYGTLEKPVRMPRIISTPGKTTKFRIPLEFTVNSHLIRRINTQNPKYRLCSRKSKVNEWQPNTNRLPPCVTIMNVFVPIQLMIPINVETIVENTEQHIVQDTDVDDNKYAKRVFDGSEKNFARTQDDYYRSQMAVGDPIRAKRTKRTTQHDENALNDTVAMVKKIVQAIRRRDKK